MTHPIVPQIIELVNPIAENLGLEVVSVVFHTHQNPPVLRVDIRNLTTDTGLEDCEKMSRALDTALDESKIIPDTLNYVLEISSPGTSRDLTTDREFNAFKGFGITIKTSELYEGKEEWKGQLVNRDSEKIIISQKGKIHAIPRHLVTKVQLNDNN